MHSRGTTYPYVMSVRANYYYSGRASTPYKTHLTFFLRSLFGSAENAQSKVRAVILTLTSIFDVCSLTVDCMAPSSSSKQSHPSAHRGPTHEPVLGPQSTSRPTSSSPTAFNNDDNSSRLQSGKPSVAIERVQQISNHLDSSDLRLPSTLKYNMSSQQFKQAPHKVRRIDRVMYDLSSNMALL